MLCYRQGGFVCVTQVSICLEVRDLCYLGQQEKEEHQAKTQYWKSYLEWRGGTCSKEYSRQPYVEPEPVARTRRAIRKHFPIFLENLNIFDQFS